MKYTDWSLDDFIQQAKSVGATGLTHWCRKSQSAYVSAKYRRMHLDVAVALGWKTSKRILPYPMTVNDLLERAKRSGAQKVSDWARHDNAGYKQAKVLGYLPLIGNELGWKIRSTEQYRNFTLEKFIAAARKCECETKTEFRLNHPRLVNAMRNAGCLPAVFSELWPTRKHKIVTTQSLSALATQCGATGLSSWSTLNPGGYQAARRAGLLDEVVESMGWLRRRK